MSAAKISPLRGVPKAEQRHVLPSTAVQTTKVHRYVFFWLLDKRRLAILKETVGGRPWG